MSLTAIAFAVGLGVQVAPQSPNPVPELCEDESYPRCPEAHARSRRLLGLETIEAEADAGAEVYRAYYVNGHSYVRARGVDMPAIAFERRPGETPRVTVTTATGQRLQAQVSDEIWRSVREVSQRAAREAGPRLRWPDGVCLHAWQTTVEMTHSGVVGGNGQPFRQWSVIVCDPGPMTELGFEIADLAMTLLPQCQDIPSVIPHRNVVERIDECAWRHGRSDAV